MITTIFRNKEINVKKQLTLTESLSFINGVVGGVVDLEDGLYSVLLYEPALVFSFFSVYTDIEISDISEVEVYDNLKECEDFIASVTSMDGFNREQYELLLLKINKQIEFERQRIIHKQNSAMDDMFESLNELLNTLNDKAESINIKTVNRFLKGLNPDELIKAYKKSGVGDKVRDDVIGKLAKENKD